MARLTSLLLLGAVGASAHPSGHGHQHFHKRDNQKENVERNIGDVITAVINGQTVSWTQTEDYGPAATTSAASVPMIKADDAVAVTSSTVFATTLSTAFTLSTSTSISAAATSTAASSSSSSSDSGVTEFTTFDDYCSSSSSKRATKEEIAYTGNIGTTYGCNLMPVASEAVAAQYNNTIKFYGATEDMTCYIWNKIGSDNAIDGFFENEGAQTFSLASGGVQYWAANSNSQGGASCWPSSIGVETTSAGEYAGTWVEFDFENSSNDGWSGADASCIVAQAAGLTVYGLEVCNADDSSLCSSISSGATTVISAYTQALTDADGIGLQADGPLKITVNVGY